MRGTQSKFLRRVWVCAFHSIEYCCAAWGPGYPRDFSGRISPLHRRTSCYLMSPATVMYSLLEGFPPPSVSCDNSATVRKVIDRLSASVWKSDMCPFEERGEAYDVVAGGAFPVDVAPLQCHRNTRYFCGKTRKDRSSPTTFL